MNVIHRRGWEIPDRLATPEHFVFNRRSFVAAGVSALTLSPLGATAQRLSDVAKLPDPSADLYPAKRNEKYVLDRAITRKSMATTITSMNSALRNRSLRRPRRYRSGHGR
jgi:methionine sulfoxide reductase catalytic subunit